MGPFSYNINIPRKCYYGFESRLLRHKTATKTHEKRLQRGELGSPLLQYLPVQCSPVDTVFPFASKRPCTISSININASFRLFSR